MSRVTVSPSRDHFLRHGQPWFWLADTCWSAFTNATESEWEEYLDFRRSQGFNTVQVNILPQWDASECGPRLLPFGLVDGKYDFTNIKEDYFARAQRMCAAAVARDIVPALVVLWCNYVPGTWGSKRVPQNVIPRQYLESVVNLMVDRFAPFEPVWIVSGDTNFEEPEAAEYYRIAAEIIQKKDPAGLMTLHLAGCLTDVPSNLLDASWYHFFAYQSGHGPADQPKAYSMAQHFAAIMPKRPVLNSEPCYEGYAAYTYAPRFSAFEVRRAAWQSLLSGAPAGITYGAHGIWCWHKAGKVFAGAAATSMPFDRQTALQFPGAGDYAFTKWLFETYGLFGIQASDRLCSPTEEVRLGLARDASRFALYCPFATEVELTFDVSAYDLTLVQLTDRRFCTPLFTRNGEQWKLRLPEMNSDFLVLGKRK